MLVEGCEGHSIAIKRHRHLLMTEHEPLRHIGSPTEKTALDKALHACVGDIKGIP